MNAMSAWSSCAVSSMGREWVASGQSSTVGSGISAAGDGRVQGHMQSSELRTGEAFGQQEFHRVVLGCL
jgi:hypothetical protein